MISKTSQGPEWKADGEAELVQGNPDGKIERKGGNVMTIVKAEGDDLAHSDGKTAQKTIELIKKHKDKRKKRESKFHRGLFKAFIEQPIETGIVLGDSIPQV